VGEIFVINSLTLAFQYFLL